jgi:hypothetical protein
MCFVWMGNGWAELPQVRCLLAYDPQADFATIHNHNGCTTSTSHTPCPTQALGGLSFPDGQNILYHNGSKLGARQ